MATGNRGGRPKKPTALHVLNGNPSNIKNLEEKYESEPRPQEYTPDNIPPPPDRLTTVGRECWIDTATFLSRLHLLTVADVRMLELYCTAYEKYRACDELINKAGTQFYQPYAGNKAVMELPHGTTMRAYMKTMTELSREFGMTPAARGRMTLPEDKEAEDEMERLLRGG
jgi:P27 family predicted phage terminase small subunit